MWDNDDAIQMMRDRECADVVGFCRRCGREIYDSIWREPGEELCRTCLEEAEREESYDDQTS